MGKFKNKREKGAFYENLIGKELLKKRYIIIEKNFIGKFGEVDIIAEDLDTHTLIFVEVKAKDKNLGVHPFEAVDSAKKGKIILAAKEYLFINHRVDCFIRFDVAGVILDGDEVESIEILEDAFQA